jgi:multisubunit Na+/H+ antiporter MnhC subunit
MKTKTKIILGVVLAVLAVVLFLVAEGDHSSSPSIPAATSSNPNDPAVKGLSIN